MRISRWNRAEKIDFYRAYLEAVFPVLEGERPPDVVSSGCKAFLRQYAGMDFNEGMNGEVGSKATDGKAANEGMDVKVAHVNHQSIRSDDRLLLSQFLLAGLTEKLRAREG